MRMTRPWVYLALLLQLAALVPAEDDIVTIGKTRYKKTPFLQRTSYKRIVVDDEGQVFFRGEYNNLLVWRPRDSRLKEYAGYTIYDMVNNNGTVWIASKEGFFTFNNDDLDRVHMGSEENSTLWLQLALGADRSDAIYATNSQSSLYEYRASSPAGLRLVPEVQNATQIAANGRGDLYYTNRANDTFELMRRGFQGPPVLLQSDVQIFYTWQLEVDRINNYLYICNHLGLYYIAPGDSAMREVPAFRTRVTGIGFDTQGNMYLGTGTEIFKLIRIDDKPTLEDKLADLESQMEQRYEELDRVNRELRKDFEMKHSELERKVDALEYETNRTLSEMEAKLEAMGHSHNCSCSTLTINGNVKIIGVEHNNYN